MTRRIWRVVYAALMLAWVTFQMWKVWGTPEFWPMVVFSLIFSLVVSKAAKDRQEDLRARLPGARTFGL
jgi:1,4-dihydroxy-2-naphthoate octaprenyltransferase